RGDVEGRRAARHRVHPAGEHAEGRRPRRARPRLHPGAVRARRGDARQRVVRLHTRDRQRGLRAPVKTILGIISALFIAASPFVLYWTLTNHDVAVAAITLIAWVIIRTIPILLSAKKEQRNAALQLPAIALVFAILG